MEGHEKMKAIRRYYVTSRGSIHTPRCAILKRSEVGCSSTTGSLPDLIKHRGYKFCKRCDPWSYHYTAISTWEPIVVKEIRQDVIRLARYYFRNGAEIKNSSKINLAEIKKSAAEETYRPLAKLVEKEANIRKANVK